MSQILQRTCGFEGRKIEAEIGSWKYIDSLEDAFGGNSVNYYEVGGVVASNCTTKISFFVEFGADTSCDIGEVRRSMPPFRSAQIGSTWVMLKRRGCI